MSVRSGFFSSIDNDRKYNADDMSEIWGGLYGLGGVGESHIIGIVSGFKDELKVTVDQSKNEATIKPGLIVCMNSGVPNSDRPKYLYAMIDDEPITLPKATQGTVVQQFLYVEFNFLAEDETEKIGSETVKGSRSVRIFLSSNPVLPNGTYIVRSCIAAIIWHPDSSGVYKWFPESMGSKVDARQGAAYFKDFRENNLVKIATTASNTFNLKYIRPGYDAPERLLVSLPSGISLTNFIGVEIHGVTCKDRWVPIKIVDQGYYPSEKKIWVCLYCGSENSRIHVDQQVNITFDLYYT